MVIVYLSTLFHQNSLRTGHQNSLRIGHPFRGTFLGFYYKQVELSRAALEFSFTSLLSGQNISVWVQIFCGQSKYFVGVNLGLKKVCYQQNFDPDEKV